jgi:hypothetical protein
MEDVGVIKFASKDDAGKIKEGVVTNDNQLPG